MWLIEDHCFNFGKSLNSKFIKAMSLTIKTTTMAATLRSQRSRVHCIERTSEGGAINYLKKYDVNGKPRV